MYSLRPAKPSDITAILPLANEQGARHASLPKTTQSLRSFIQTSEDSFRTPKGQTAQSGNYFWVLTDQDQVVGTIAIEAFTGQKEPFYSYRRETLINASYRLKVKQSIPVLYQSHELAGYSQLHSITLASEHRNPRAIAFLIQGILLFIAEHASYFSDRLLFEFPGFKDERGESPLWNDLGQHFFQMSLKEACYHASIEDKALIAQLMPNQPLYENLLSNTTQSTLGEPQQDLADYYQAFISEGFRPSNHIDIFDGGPCLTCFTSSLWTKQESARTRLTGLPENHTDTIAMNTSKEHPLILLLPQHQPDFIQPLNLTSKEWIRWVTLNTEGMSEHHQGEGVL